MIRNLILAIIAGLLWSGAAFARQQPVEIREMVTAANVSAVMDRLEQAARANQPVSLHLTFTGTWTDDYRFQYYPRFEHFEVMASGRDLMVDEGVEFVDGQNVVAGLFRIELDGTSMTAVALPAGQTGSPTGKPSH